PGIRRERQECLGRECRGPSLAMEWLSVELNLRPNETGFGSGRWNGLGARCEQQHLLIYGIGLETDEWATRSGVCGQRHQCLGGERPERGVAVGWLPVEYEARSQVTGLGGKRWLRLRSRCNGRHLFVERLGVAVNPRPASTSIRRLVRPLLV